MPKAAKNSIIAFEEMTGITERITISHETRDKFKGAGKTRKAIRPPPSHPLISHILLSEDVLLNYRLLLQHKLFYLWQHQALSDFICHPTLFDSFECTYKHAEEERSSLVYWRSEQREFATADVLYQAFTTHLATRQAPPSIEAGHSTAPLTTSHSEETSDPHSASSDVEIPTSSAPLAELPLYHSTPYLKPLKVLPPATSHILSGHSSESNNITSRSSRSISVPAASATQQQSLTTGHMEQTVSPLSPEINKSPSSSSGEVTPSSSPVLNIPTHMSPLTWPLTSSSLPTSTQTRPTNVNPSTSTIAMIQNTSSGPLLCM
ncbi:hypothetical protein P691DRAFT_766721 [Macrolepiota fuliginosa MF-IS2]|uniref:Uncharacterized protein n=1 Tax=Macrolepiota fuliginosa MF-IS2 TaxID=1400762 RepID=A0A9P5WYB5_9AGAR|nr:hypothetical protein P691DRAFT_766721 [Macrolepiota fuliginosa MF-IS2]